MNPLVKRAEATSLTVKKYQDRSFAWGSCDCGKIAAFHARKFGWNVPKTGTYRSAVGAKKYLASLGVETMPDLLDQIGFPRIAPAMAMIGDFLAAPADDPIGGIGIHLGGDKMMAFHEEFDGPVVIAFDMSKIIGAWSILPVVTSNG